MGVILARGENVEDALAKAEKAYSKLEVEVLPR
jgi:formate-dependent phosphoribosylglycinamide formyltransferase (GAR transformylase)